MSAATTLTFGYAADPPSDVFDNYISKYFNHYLVESAKKKEGHNFRFLQHSNGIIVLCIDPSHVLFRELRSKHPNGTEEAVTIQAIAFGSQRRQNQNQEGERDLSAIQVKGKRKKNALGCQVDTCLCTVTLSTGTVYVMPACINGFVLELNARLVEQPQLLVTAPLNEGFLAVINPSAKTTLSAFKKVHTATSGETLLEEGE